MAQESARYTELRARLVEPYEARHGKIQCVIKVGSATCELAAGAESVKEEFLKLVRASGRDDIEIKQTGCTGRCAKEPIVGVYVKGEKPYKYEQVTVDLVQQIFEHHILRGEALHPYILDKTTQNRYSYVVTMCSTICQPDSGIDWSDVFQDRLLVNNVDPAVIRVYQGGCMGLCVDQEERGKSMSMLVFPQRVTYKFSSIEELDAIIKCHFVDHQICEMYIAELDPLTNRFLSHYGDVAFFNRQTRITLRNSGLIDPDSLVEYLRVDGYASLAKTLEAKNRQDVIDTIAKSGLRGRGGAGYPTGKKWMAAHREEGSQKYIVCNADEGDPGAFMDRSALEGDPFSIIEGMTIGAYAIGANQGYLYIRAEYPLAIKRIENAIQQARAAGLLGAKILGSSFSFDLDVRLGAGAFVCGEETALIRSIEGERGQPVIRPPYPTQRGLWGKPTVINNVETWANVAPIILYGADWFSRIGTATSKGTKVFALAGKVKNTGLIEVPMGTRLQNIIYEIGGGLKEGRVLKAVQTGGPSGGCIPVSRMDTVVDYESLRDIGSIMGSGGMIVVDDQDCMVANAKFFLEFTQDESCGKCVPCREGTLRMLEILERIVDGEGTSEDLNKLERLGHLIKRTSLCGLGQSAPNPLLSSLEHFREEFLAHVEEKQCPTQRCKKLVRYEVIATACTGCTLCAKKCPVSCIRGSLRQIHHIDPSRCIKCGECYKVCRFKAIAKH